MKRRISSSEIRSFTFNFNGSFWVYWTLDYILSSDFLIQKTLIAFLLKQAQCWLTEWFKQNSKFSMTYRTKFFQNTQWTKAFVYMKKHWSLVPKMLKIFIKLQLGGPKNFLRTVPNYREREKLAFLSSVEEYSGFSDESVSEINELSMLVRDTLLEFFRPRARVPRSL